MNARTRVKIFLMTLYPLINASLIHAMPSDEERRAFDLGIAQERQIFENQMRTPQPGQRTQEIERFNRQKIQDKIALNQNLEGLTFEEKQVVIAGYQQNLLNQMNDLRQKLKQLPPEENNRQTQRKEFDKKISKEIQDFYSR